MAECMGMCCNVIRGPSDLGGAMIIFLEHDWNPLKDLQISAGPLKRSVSG